MSKQGKSRTPLIVGIIAAVVILASLLVVLLTQCTGGETGTTAPVTDPVSVVEDTTLYWNIDRALYDGKSEAGMSSRAMGKDGYYHIRMFSNGQTMELLATDRRVVNSLEAKDLMGLEIDENGVITKVIPIEDMPLTKIGWKFYVQSVGGKTVKLNSSNKFDGMELVLKVEGDAKSYDMSPNENGIVGKESMPEVNDRVICVGDLEGNLLAIYIYDSSQRIVTFTADCEHCKAQVEWTEWTNEKSLPTAGGHYKLMKDVKLTAQQNTKADAKICLDLGGKKVDGASGKRVYSIANLNGELAIMDTSEEKTGRMSSHGQFKDQGAIIFIRYGAFYLYDGILDGSDAVTTSGYGSTTVYVAGERYFFMHGGELIGGKSMYTVNEKTGKYQASVGATMVVRGKFVMNDGVIRGGHAQSVSYMSGTTRKYERGIGGNLYVSSGGIVEINGGTIKNGKAGVGGNIFMDGTAEFTMNGGTISGGRTTDPGRTAGNIYFGAKVVAEINGGTISGGTSYGAAGNIHLLGKLTFNGGYITGGRVLDAETNKFKDGSTAFNLYVANAARFAMYGGTITGGVSAVDSSATDNKNTTVVLSGYATIDGAPKGRPNLTIQVGSEPVNVMVGNLYDSAVIGVDASGIFTKPTKEANLDNFRSDVAGADILYYDGCIALGKLACLCGSEEHFGACDGEQLLWGPWTSASSLPTATGNYYLMKDVARMGNVSIGSSANPDVLVNLDLNGKTVDFGRRVATTFGDMNIVDHVGGGKLMGGAPLGGKDHTGVILMAGSSTVGLYGGTVALREEHSSASTGGVFGVAAAATLNIYGGTVDGTNAVGFITETVKHEATETEEAWTETVTKASSVTKGGAIRVTGTLNVYGGEIIGGDVVNQGGAIYGEKTGVINLYGGKVYGGTAVQGGNIYLDGTATLNVKGGLVTGGKTKANTKNVTSDSNGANIYVGKTATLNVLSGVVEKGLSVNGGGNIYCAGNMNMAGGVIRDGDSTTSVHVYSKNMMAVNAKITFSGGTIAGYVSLVTNSDAGAHLTVSGKPVLAGGEHNLRLVSTNESKYPRPVVTVDGELEEGAQIVINQTGVVSGETVEANVKAFSCTDPFNTAILTEDKTIALGYVHCLCGDDTHKSWCNGKDLLWLAWAGDSNLTTEGNYYLTKTVTTGGQRTIGVNGNSDLTINLDLCGRTYGGNGRAALVYSKLNIVDSMTGGKITGKGNNNDHTATFLMAKGSCVNLYEGTITSEAVTKTITHGGVVGVGTGSVLNIYPDGIVDGSNANVTKYGGAIRLTGEMNLMGGTIYGGTAPYGGSVAVEQGGNLIMHSGKITDGVATFAGGNIYFSAGSEAQILGGTIEKGEATRYGGNLYQMAADEEQAAANVPGSSVIISGEAKILDGFNSGTGTYNGGNIYIDKECGMVLAEKAEVSGGHSVNGGGNFYVGGTLSIRDQAIIKNGTCASSAQQYGKNVMVNNGILNLFGGEIAGYISAINSGAGENCVINISGSPKVNAGTTNLRMTYTGTGSNKYPTIVLDEVSGEAMIGIRLENKTIHNIDGVANTGMFVSTANGAAAANESFFYADAPTGGKVVLMEDGLNIHGEGYRVACACGGRLENSSFHTCEEKTWTPWKTASALPVEGYYYLSTDIIEPDQINLTGLKNDRQLGIDLNDHVITAANSKRVFRLYDGNTTDNTYVYTLTITDNGNGDGRILPDPEGVDQGDIVWITEKNQTVNLFGGTLDGSGSTVTNNNPGMVVSVGRGTFNMFGGTVKGGTYHATSGNESLGAAIGITSNNNGGTVNLFGGTVVAGTADHGNSICAHGPNAKLNLGGTAVSDIYLAADDNGVCGKLTILDGFTVPATAIKIGMTIPGIFAENVATDLSEAFLSSNGGYTIRYNAEKTLEMFQQHAHCFCVNAETLPEGHTCDSKQIWEPVASSAANPFVMQDGGHYHLDWTGAVAKKIQVPAGATAYLCLADATIRAQSTIELGQGSKIVICSCGNNGTISTTANTPLHVKNSSTAILMSGTINGTNGSAASVISVKVEASSTFEMYGGTVTGGCANPDASKFETSTRRGNICIDGTAKLMGGTITGGKYDTSNRDVTVFSSNNVTVGGKIKIGYMMLSSCRLTVKEENLDCQIGINTTKSDLIIAVTSTDVSGCFTSINPDATKNAVGWKNGNLVLGPKADHQHCFCIGADTKPDGHQCDSLTAWTAIAASAGTPTTLTDGGHYYLNWTGGSPQPVVIPANATVYLCLNGASMRASSVVQLGQNAKIVICDCSEGQTGVLTTTEKTPLHVKNSSTAILMSGTINGTYGSTASVISVKVEASSTFEMYGGTVTGGCKNPDAGKFETTTRGGNMCIDGTAKLMGGTITGGKYGTSNRDVTVFSSNNVTVGGKIKIGYMLVFNSKLNVITKDMEAQIGITSNTPTAAFANADADVSSCFTSVHTSYNTVGWKDGGLILGTKADHQHCFCIGAGTKPAGHQCDTLTAWTGIAASQGAATVLTNGYYYLNWTGASAQSLVVEPNATAYLCLNGATIYAVKVLTVSDGATLHICDCSANQTGKMGASGSTSAPIIDLSSATRTVNLYSGTITGAHATEGTKKAVTVQLGGGYGTFRMYGGQIENGYSTGNGGNVVIGGLNCKFYLYDGLIIGGSVASGKHGGNVAMLKGEFIMNGGAISGGQTNGKGGNVMLIPTATDAQPVFTMNGGTISGGLASGTNAANGGNVAVNAVNPSSGTNSATFIMNGGTIIGGTATTTAGNIYIQGKNDTVTINGGSVIGGTAPTGACIYVNGGTLTVDTDAVVESIVRK